MRSSNAGAAACRAQALAALQDRCKATLAFEEVTATPAGRAADASAEPVTAAIVHGLLGQGRNWRSWARKLAATAAEMTQRCCISELSSRTSPRVSGKALLT